MRRQNSFTQEDMISFGFSARHWQQIEAGRPITMKTLLRIGEVFNTSLVELIEGLESPRVKKNEESGRIIKKNRHR